MATKSKTTHKVTLDKKGIYRESGSNNARINWTFKESTKNFAGYEVRWMYKTTRYGSKTIALDQWIKEDAKSVKKGTKYSIWSIPDNAVTIGVQVRALGTKNKKGKRTWTGSWTKVATYHPGVKNNIKVPDDPEITQNSDYSSFQLSVKDYVDDSAGLANAILFQLQYSVAGGTNTTPDTGKPKYKGTSLIVPLNKTSKSASCWYTANPGLKYNVRAAGCYYKEEGGTKTLVGHGDWTKWSDDFYSAPSKPIQIESSVISQSMVRTQILKYEGSGSDNLFLNNQPIKMKHDFQFLGILDGFDDWAELTQDDLGEFAKIVASGDSIESNTYIFTGIQLGYYKYYVVRVRSRHPIDNNIVSEWYLDMKNIQIGKKPDPPTIWTHKTYISVGEDIALYWTHNAEDGGIEKQVWIEWNVNDTFWRSEYIANMLSIEEDVESHYMMLSGKNYSKKAVTSGKIYPLDVLKDGDIFKWRARTCGVSGEWSDPSNERELYCFAKPECSIGCEDINEEGEITSLPINAKITFTPSTQTVTVMSWSITCDEDVEMIESDGKFVKHEAGASLVTNTYYGPSFVDGVYDLEIDYSQAHLEPGYRYSINVSLYSTSGMECSATLPFIFEPEDQDLYDIVVENEFYDQESKIYTFYPNVMDTETEENIEGYNIKVYRINYDDSLTLLPTQTASGEYSSFVYDPHPTIGTSRYRIVATNVDTGFNIFMDHEVEIPEYSIIIQWDEHWFSRTDNSYDAEMIMNAKNMGSQSLLTLPYNITTSYQNNKDITMVEYIGRKHPVAYCGTQLGESISLSSVIPKDDTDTLELIRRLNNYMGSCYIREPGGAGFNAIVKITHSIGYNALTIPINIEAIRVEGEA